jgi:hypothetical protein
LDEESTGLFGAFTERQVTALQDGIKTAIQTVNTELENREKTQLYSERNLAAVNALLDRLSSEEVTEIGLDVDQEQFDQLNLTLEKTEESGKLAAAAVGAIGQLGGQAKTAIDFLGQSTLNLVGQANSAKGAYQQLLDIAERAFQVAQDAANLNAQNSSNGLFFGGRPQYRNEGGASRGQDTIPAMLSPEEFVVNSRQSRNFLPELQAINAGNAPSVSSGGTGDTNITIGDINVSSSSNVPGQTGREIANSIKRELRRGTTRL